MDPTVRRGLRHRILSKSNVFETYIMDPTLKGNWRLEMSSSGFHPHLLGFVLHLMEPPDLRLFCLKKGEFGKPSPKIINFGPFQMGFGLFGLPTIQFSGFPKALKLPIKLP